MNFQNILYDYPQAAYLLFLLPIFLLLFWSLYQYRQDLLQRFFNSKVYRQLITPERKAIFWIKACLFCCVWIFAILAFMYPKGNERYAYALSEPKAQKYVLRRKAHDVIFLIDVSASMSLTDTRSHISRLDYAKEIGDEIMRRLSGENGTLYAFTSETMQIVPPTLDYLFLRMMLSGLAINEGETSGTNLIKAMTTIGKDFFNPTQRLKTLILLTDGGDTAIEGLQGTEREKAIASLTTQLKNAQTEQLRVFTVGVGSKQGQDLPGMTYQGKLVHSSLQEDILQKLSQAGRGRYYFANDYSSMQIAEDIIDQMSKGQIYQTEERTQTQRHIPLVYDDYFQFPLALAILCLMLILLIPETNQLRKQ